MTIGQEFKKLEDAKTLVRKAIQQNYSPMLTEDPFEQYSKEIDKFGFVAEADYEGVDNYVTNTERQYSLPDTITKIRDYAFYNDRSMIDLIITSPALVTLGKHVFKETKIESKEGSIYVPDDLYDSYMADESWNVYTIKKASELVENPEEVYPIETLSGRVTVEKLGTLTLEVMQKAL